MNYRVVYDGVYSTIVPTAEETDGHTVFPSFSEAKTMLLRDLRNMRDWYRDAVTKASALRRSDIAEREES